MAARDDSLDELRALYAEVEAALADVTCEGTADCCRFLVTGRTPYATPVELALVAKAVGARGGVTVDDQVRRKKLPTLDERERTGTCPMLGDDGRCSVYASRPFGCRTFFCHRASRRVDAAQMKRWVGQLKAIAIAFDPVNGEEGRPLPRAWADRSARKRGRR